jgi:hypothetical protein
MFDGSIPVDRTRGEVAARRDSEAANVLGLNMVHELVTGRQQLELRSSPGRSQRLRPTSRSARYPRIQWQAGGSGRGSQIVKARLRRLSKSAGQPVTVNVADAALPLWRPLAWKVSLLPG